MRGTLVETLIGAVVLLVSGWFLYFSFSGTDLTSDGYQISARFERIDGINVGSDVRISGVKIGRVVSHSLDPDTFTASVVMTVDHGITLPDDSYAKISMDGLLGGFYIAIVPGMSLETLVAGEEMPEPGEGSLDLMGLIGRVIHGSVGDE